jgi:hypothetical protein
MIFTHGGNLTLGWDEAPRQDAAALGLQEDGEAFHNLVFKDAYFRIPTTLEACFDTLRSTYISSGWEGVDELLRSNNLHFERHAHRLAGREPTLEEALGRRLPLYRLLQVARGEIEHLTSQAVAPLTEVAKASALARLEEARQQIRDEVQRYFALRPAGAVRALESLPAATPRPAPILYTPDWQSPDWRGLREALKDCSALLARLQKAEERAAKAIGRGMEALAELGADVPVTERIAVSSAPLAFRAMREDPEVARFQGEANDARTALHEYLGGAAAEFPVLWRIYTTQNLADDARLGEEVLQVLRSAWKSNNDLTDAINETPATVWKFPAVVYEAMTVGAVPRLSIAWSAAEARMGEEAGMRAASAIGLITGLSLMGTAGLAAVAGTAVVAPPLVVAITIVDVLVNLFDAWQEYADYQLHKNAFAASLDPSRSLAAEPSFLWAAFVISMDLLSVLPGPAPRVRS